MLRFVTGLYIGTLLGMIIASFCMAAKIGDMQGQETESEYRCENITECGCQDICCFTCFVASVCEKDKKCKNNPGICGKAIKLK